MKRVKYQKPTKEEALAFAEKGINGWCLRNLKGNWVVHECMKYFDDCQFPEYHVLVDNLDDYERIEKQLLAIVPAIYMVKPFLTTKLLREDHTRSNL